MIFPLGRRVQGVLIVAQRAIQVRGDEKGTEFDDDRNALSATLGYFPGTIVNREC
jgi:hypothetical protein